MTGRRNIIIAITAIVIFAATVGFFITLDVSPQIAYARLFIDAGLVIGLIAVIMAFYKEKVVSTDFIIQALRALKNGQYKTRITATEQQAFSEVVTSINDLAVALEAQHDKQEEIKRSLREELLPKLKQKENGPLPEHSYHPELGPVLTITSPQGVKPIQEGYGFRDIIPVPMEKKVVESKLNNTLIASNPPKAESPKELTTLDTQDLNELYQRFIGAQKSFNIDQIEYNLFLKTIEKTKEELMSSYHCNNILFDIVKESNQVALQPKIIR